jgi:hypothetical protein
MDPSTLPIDQRTDLADSWLDTFEMFDLFDPQHMESEPSIVLPVTLVADKLSEWDEIHITNQALWLGNTAEQTFRRYPLSMVDNVYVFTDGAGVEGYEQKGVVIALLTIKARSGRDPTQLHSQLVVLPDQTHMHRLLDHFFIIDDTWKRKIQAQRDLVYLEDMKRRQRASS